MHVDWLRALRLEQDFFGYLADQQEYGFLVNKKLMIKHMATLDGQMCKVSEDVHEGLPYLCVPHVGKKEGEYPYMAKPFLKNGEYNKYVEDWYRMSGMPAEHKVAGPFTRVTFKKADINSNKQMKDYLLACGWVPDKWNYNKETGKVTSPKLSYEDSFIGVEGKLGSGIAHYFICKHRFSQLNGWVKRIRPDGRLTAGVSGLAITGRLKHTNVVNIPGGEWGDDGNWKGAFFGHEMRSVFIARNGYRVVGCDADQIQIRMLCHYMGDEAYSAAVVAGKTEDGTDIHSVNQRLAGLPTRGKAKTFIYAFLFGAGDKNLAAQLGITIKELRRVRARFLRGLPKLKALIDSLKRAWKKNGYLVGLDGRKILVEKEHTLLVYLMQAAEAVIMKVATCYAHKWIKSRGLDAHMVAHVHDEYQWEVKAEHAEEVGELLTKAIVKAYENFNINIEGGAAYAVGLSWADTH